jgi:energy-converting hydrogenase Eha subunit H
VFKALCNVLGIIPFVDKVIVIVATVPIVVFVVIIIIIIIHYYSLPTGLIDGHGVHQML